jgi:5-methylcytosine-specific restriction protein A
MQTPVSKRIFPLSAFSWELLSERIAIKTTDKSCFHHHGTGIPLEICWFFHLDGEQTKSVRPVRLRYQGNIYKGHFQQDTPLRRWRLFWKSDFVEALRGTCPHWYTAFAEMDEPAGRPPLLRFESLNDECSDFTIEIIIPELLLPDSEFDLTEETTPRTEGGSRQVVGTRYERDAVNRRKAIEFHGTICSVCRFDFGRTYGSHGVGFIEVHHAKPLGAQNGPHLVDPQTELFPVCANCHRMIHRKKDDVLSLNDLRALINSQG